MFAVISGGESNRASAAHSTVPGGSQNQALGDYSFAAGRRAIAEYDGSFVWADHTDADFASEQVDQFRVRANGGVRFDVNNSGWLKVYDADSKLITTSTGGYLTLAGYWELPSDINLKENFRPVDGKEILDKIAQLSIRRWNYRNEEDNITHIGPVAQDFHALFGLGRDDVTISTIDPAGVALAAIQELHRKNADLEAEVAELKALVERLLAERQ
jgi:hypothetical protein